MERVRGEGGAKLNEGDEEGAEAAARDTARDGTRPLVSVWPCVTKGGGFELEATRTPRP